MREGRQSGAAVSSPIPNGERSREARVRGLPKSTLSVDSPSPQRGEGAARARRQAFVGAASALRDAAIETPELDARLLLCHAAGLTQEAYVASPDAPMSEDAASRFDAMIARRLKGEPYRGLLARRNFLAGHSLSINATLDPRPDTETLIDAVLSTLTREGRRDEKHRILDLGTGARLHSADAAGRGFRRREASAVM